MDLNGYVIEVMARQYLAERRAAATREHAAREASAASSLRAALGRALVRVGQRLQAGPPDVRATA